MADASLRFERATPAHARLLAPVMLPAHVQEVAASSGRAPLAALEASIADSALALALRVEGEVAAVFGVGAAPGPRDTLLGGCAVGIPWMLAGEAIARHPRVLLTHSRPFIDYCHRLHPVLVNWVPAGYEAALRWAAWLGFEVGEAEAWGAHGLPFCRILRRAAHV